MNTAELRQSYPFLSDVIEIANIRLVNDTVYEPGLGVITPSDAYDRAGDTILQELARFGVVTTWVEMAMGAAIVAAKYSDPRGDVYARALRLYYTAMEMMPAEARAAQAKKQAALLGATERSRLAEAVGAYGGEAVRSDMTRHRPSYLAPAAG